MIFNFCENQNATIIIDKIISQIETFNECSNFICAHFFDVHGKPPDYIPDRSDYTYLTENNFNYRTDKSLHSTTVYKSKREKFKKGKTKFERDKLLSEIKYADLRLKHLYSYLDNKKFDNMTVILMGDHGTRGDMEVNINKNYINETVNRSYNNIGFFIKDNKYNFKNKKSDFIETIDIFPSLAARYKNIYNYKKTIKQFNGKNTLFSNVKNYTVSESIYDTYYEMLINLKNHSMFSSFELKDDKISNQRKKIFINKNNIEIKSISKKLNQNLNILKKNIPKIQIYYFKK